MYKELVELKKNSYSSKSHYAVAAIVKMKDGNIFKGVNVENPSFKDGLCAEQVAIGTAIANGYTKGDFDSIYVLGSSKHAITPCFLCRQVLVEFFNKECSIITYDQSGIETKYTLNELCPHTFSEEDLNDKWIKKIIK